MKCLAKLIKTFWTAIIEEFKVNIFKKFQGEFSIYFQQKKHFVIRFAIDIENEEKTEQSVVKAQLSRETRSCWARIVFFFSTF